jgi:signal-transduction protein with cAMP-binding, CBS, and nucleotidyltransferase domain
VLPDDHSAATLRSPDRRPWQLKREPPFSRSHIGDTLEVDKTIQNILDRKGSEVLTIPPGATIKNAIDQMCKRGVAAVIVRSGDRIIGIVSERDIVRAVCRLGERGLTAAINEALAMTKITVGPMTMSPLQYHCVKSIGIKV